MLQKSYAQFFKTAILKKAQLINPDNLTLRENFFSKQIWLDFPKNPAELHKFRPLQ